MQLPKTNEQFIKNIRENVGFKDSDAIIAVVSIGQGRTPGQLPYKDILQIPGVLLTQRPCEFTIVLTDVANLHELVKVLDNWAVQVSILAPDSMAKEFPEVAGIPMVIFTKAPGTIQALTEKASIDWLLSSFELFIAGWIILLRTMKMGDSRTFVSTSRKLTNFVTSPIVGYNPETLRCTYADSPTEETPAPKRECDCPSCSAIREIANLPPRKSAQSESGSTQPPVPEGMPTDLLRQFVELLEGLEARQGK